MARELNEKDITILKKLAPECGDLTCGGIGTPVPCDPAPGLQPFCRECRGFYRADRANFPMKSWPTSPKRSSTGEEGLGCVEVEDAEALVKIIHDRISPEMAKKVIAAYESGADCDR